MGLLCGLAAALYVRTLYRAEDFFGEWRIPAWLKPAIGGLFVGLVLRFFPQIYGTGLHAVEGALWARFPWEILLALLFAELVANVATLGSGGSGGIFAPSLFMGAMLGGAFGTLAHGLFPNWAAGPGAYAMVGMAAFFAAAAKAPTTSILILFEMTNDYRIMLPLMAAVVAATYVSHAQLPHSIYTLKLFQRGITYPYEPEPEPAIVEPGLQAPKEAV
ncbi:MAG: chloride channel protein [Bryobacterales bacterium]